MAKKPELNPKINKQNFKHAAGKCRLCGNGPYEVLNVHRIQAGRDGGEYTKLNSVPVCANCHALVETGQIEIHGWFSSTKGLVLHVTDENGDEQFL